MFNINFIFYFLCMVNMTVSMMLSTLAKLTQCLRHWRTSVRTTYDQHDITMDHPQSGNQGQDKEICSLLQEVMQQCCIILFRTSQISHYKM